MSNTNQRLLEALRKIRDEGAPFDSYGICSTVKYFCFQAGHPVPQVMALATERLLMQWPLAQTAECGYPVGGLAEFRAELLQWTMWQNPRRHELLHWAIQHLENVLCPQ